MCGAYGFSVKDAKKVYDRFDIDNTLESFKPRYNIRPGQMNPVIFSQEHTEIKPMFWGLIPYWAKEGHNSFKTINARKETVADLSSYRVPFRKRRCLIPADFFYEPDKKHFPKSPHPWYCFRMKDQSMFAFAGLYDIWKDKNSDKEIYSYSIITTEPNTVVGEVHDRMPVILHKDDEKTWLDPDIQEPEQLFPLLTQYQPEKMESWRVGDEARNPRNDYPELMNVYVEEQGNLLGSK